MGGATYYGTNVSNGLPQVNSFVYTNSGGTSTLSDGWYGAANASGFSPTHKYRIQGGGGGVGAAGTWTPEGSIGISTSKSVGVNTTSLSDVDLQGIGNTFQGLYIGNGMVVTDNHLNGNHYIGTAYNGLMAGPVTVNGVLTVDGNWAVV